MNRQKREEMEIIHQDSDIVVIKKPGGLLAVPGCAPDKQDCAASRLRRHFPGGCPRIGILSKIEAFL